MDMPSSSSKAAVTRDPAVPGLRLRTFPKSSAYYLRYQTRTGQRREPKLGDTRVLTLSQARSMARDILARVRLGQDPAADVYAKRAAPTVADLCERYMDEHGSRKKSASNDRKMIDKYILPGWRLRKVDSFRHDDIHRLHASFKDRPYQGNRLLSLLKLVFKKAEVWGWRERGSNPCFGVKAFPEHKRRRYMRPAEAHAIAAALDAHEATAPEGVAFLRLLILTGARPKEIADARWEWLSEGVIHHPDSKTGARDIFLSPAAQAVIARLPRDHATLTGIQSPHKVWQAIRREAGCPDLRMYDLRHSFASVAVSLGMTLEQIGELLGHASTETTKRYAHLMDEDKRDAAARIATATTQRMALPGV